jgi:hypothetical protein
MGSIYLRKYGVETKIDFSLYKLDGTGLKTDAASASGDITLNRDEAAEEQLDADAFVDEGKSYSLTLSAAEMNAARIIIHVIDQSSPQVWLDKTMLVETYGNASAQHAFDLDTATQPVNLTQIGGVAQSATDLKDLADTGYNPATHKVQGVVLTDTTTAVTNDVGITQAAADKAWGTAARTLTDLTGFSLSAAGVDAIWDELMAGHVTPDSAAYVMRSLTSLISGISLAQAGAAGSITLAAASSAVNDYYKGQTICIVLGTGVGQARACYGYTGATKVALTRPDWATAPDNTSYYAILNVGSSVVAAIEDIDFPATQKAQITTIDTVVDAIKAITDTLVLADIADAVHDEVVDANAPANCNSLRETINVIASAVAGKCSGVDTDTPTFRDLGDTKNRLVTAIDADDNRTASTPDGT